MNPMGDQGGVDDELERAMDAVLADSTMFNWKCHVGQRLSPHTRFRILTQQGTCIKFSLSEFCFPHE